MEANKTNPYIVEIPFIIIIKYLFPFQATIMILHNKIVCLEQPPPLVKL